MIKLEKKQVKIISVLIALVFMGSVVALALTQTGSVASAASSGSVGVVDDYSILITKHPDFETIRTQMQTFAQEVQKEFEEKSSGMSDQEKQDYYQQCQQRLQQKQQELLDPMVKSIDEAIKKVADSKGLSVVIDSAAVVYGGQDITQDVIKNLSKK